MDAHAAHLAVVSGQGNPETNAFDLQYGLFYGTAFCLAPSLFITAAHVYAAAAADGHQVALGKIAPGDVQAQIVEEAEVFDQIDLALLLCRGLRAEILSFHFAALPFLADVASFGYAFGLELGRGPHTSHLRAFKGHIVCRRTLTQLSGEPPGYETSFVPPAGLSGAPMLFDGAGSIEVAGMILQQHSAEFRDRRMELGLALDIEELLTLDSKIIGGSIAERIFRRPKLRRPTK